MFACMAFTHELRLSVKITPVDPAKI